MTLLGKILAFVNLIIGIGLATWSVAVYTERPPWFDPAPESIQPGHKPANFALLKDDIDRLGRAAAAASSTWGAQLQRLEELEDLRGTRLKGYENWVAWAKTGNPRDNGTGFYEPVYDPATGLIDLTQPSPQVPRPAIVGPDNLPLKGVDALGDTFTADVDAVAKLAKEIDASRMKFKSLGVEILQTEARLLKMGEIRDSVQAELFYLATVELNVYETRETVLRRKRQLSNRLAELGN
jgi:hypothetical protein